MRAEARRLKPTSECCAPASKPASSKPGRSRVARTKSECTCANQATRWSAVPSSGPTANRRAVSGALKPTPPWPCAPYFSATSTRSRDVACRFGLLWKSFFKYSGTCRCEERESLNRKLPAAPIMACLGVSPAGLDRCSATMETKPIKVLLVEDNPADSRLLRELLKEITTSEFELTLVGRLSEAAARLTNEPFDVVLTDLSLPDSHGLEA